MNLDSCQLYNCLNKFQPFSYDDMEDGVVMYDMVLGMAFCESGYLLF